MFPKLLLFSTLFFFNTSTTHFQSDVQRAVETLRTKKKAINQFSNGLSADDNRTALSIVFPEVIRFNSFSDFIETKTLEWVYVDYGAEKADFSIGLFQMKPSFIEKLEEATKSDPSLFRPFSDILSYPTTLSAMEIRRKRCGAVVAAVFIGVCTSCKHENKPVAKTPDEVSGNIVTNSIGMQFVLVPKGEFMMGTTDAQFEQLAKTHSIRENRKCW